MVLAIDIGNTNTLIGAFEDERILFVERVSTSLTATDLEYALLIREALLVHGRETGQVEGAVLSSVVPTVTSNVVKAIKKHTGADTVVVGPGIKTGLSIRIDDPAQLGSDLVADAVAGINNYPCPQIIVDMGTATTFSVIDKEKRYVGTLIMTGMAISAEALTSRTSQLPRIAFDRPRSVIGKNTVESMKNGIVYSNVCAIDGIIERIEDELGEKCTVIATGGIASSVADFFKTKIIFDDELILKGLMMIYKKNS